MITEKHANITSLVSQNEADETFLRLLLDHFVKCSDEEHRKHMDDHNKTRSLCNKELHDKDVGMIWRCVLPKGHQGRHATMISWE